MQDGTDASGSVHVTETSSGTFDRTTLGNVADGGYSIQDTDTTTYSSTESVNGTETYTLVSSGVDSQTNTDTGDDVTGGDTQTITGTDSYTLTESGSLTSGTINETVVGTDTYSGSQSGNDDKGTYSGSITGGGSWTRTGSGTSSGTNSYTQSVSGNSLVGHFSQSMTGTDRYGLVDRFDDVSNADPGTSTPGNVNLHSHGLPFRDPGLTVPGEQANAVRTASALYNWMSGLVNDLKTKHGATGLDLGQIGIAQQRHRIWGWVGNPWLTPDATTAATAAKILDNYRNLLDAGQIAVLEAVAGRRDLTLGEKDGSLGVTNGVANVGAGQRAKNFGKEFGEGVGNGGKKTLKGLQALYEAASDPVGILELPPKEVG